MQIIANQYHQLTTIENPSISHRETLILAQCSMRVSDDSTTQQMQTSLYTYLLLKNRWKTKEKMGKWKDGGERLLEFRKTG